MKALLKLIVVAALGLAAYGVYATVTPPKHLYFLSHSFGGCPQRPSCVSSRAEDDQHRVAALGYTGDANTAYAMLREVVEREGGRIQHESPEYLHAVFTSPRLKLRDDVELLVLPEGRIDVRSVARFGYDDFGENRERVEKIRQGFEAIPKP